MIYYVHIHILNPAFNVLQDQYRLVCETDVHSRTSVIG